MLRDVRHLLETAAYHPREIERQLDPEAPTFIDFDPELGYTLKDYIFRDGLNDSLCAYSYHPEGGFRRQVNYADQPCRLNTYGNSFTQCAQVSDGETWQEVLAAHFREPIRNYGVGGYGVYQAYRRAMRAEDSDFAAEHIILNIWDDDHFRNLDAARWIRVAWMHQDLPRGGDDDTYPVHGFPWGHLRYDIRRDTFAEQPGYCRQAADLRKLVGADNYYDAFKDDEVVHLYTLAQGGDAPVERLEPLAEALSVDVDLRNPKRRQADARKLHSHYAVRSTQWILEQFRAWAGANDRKLMVVLSYDVPTVRRFIESGDRFDDDLVEWLSTSSLPYVDFLPKAKAEFEASALDVNSFLDRFYVGRAGAQVFGHYNPFGNFWFGHSMRQELIDWLDPKPPAYR